MSAGACKVPINQDTQDTLSTTGSKLRAFDDLTNHPRWSALSQSEQDSYVRGQIAFEEKLQEVLEKFCLEAAAINTEIATAMDTAAERALREDD